MFSCFHLCLCWSSFSRLAHYISRSSSSRSISLVGLPYLLPSPLLVHVSVAEVSSTSQWICVLLLFIVIAYVFVDEGRLMMRMSMMGEYVRRFWSWMEWTFLASSIASIFYYFIQYRQLQTVGRLFAQTSGYTFIDLRGLTSSHRLFITFICLSCFLVDPSVSAVLPVSSSSVPAHSNTFPCCQ